MNTEKLTSPTAIIVAGILIAGAVVISGSGQQSTSDTKKGIAQQIGGINETKLQACIASNTYANKITSGTESGDRAMAHLPEGQRGTPYNVLINSAGVKVEMAGALPYDDFKKAIDSLVAGTAKDQTNINLDPVTADDHVYGNRNAPIKLVEYGDMECPFCAQAYPTFKKLVDESNGQVAWVYRNYPLSIHANAQVKAEAAECAWAQGGDPVFFTYVEKLYDLVLPEKPAFDTTTL